MAGTSTKNYSNLAVDASSKIVQTGGGILTIDASSSPQSSPLVISTSITTLTVPENAAEIVIEGDVVIRYSEDPTMTHYATLAASTKLAIGLGRSTNLYVRGDSGSGTLQFHFITV